MFALGIPFFIHESPRWLISRDRRAEVRDTEEDLLNCEGNEPLLARSCDVLRNTVVDPEPLYISEIAPPAIRGQLIGMYEIGWQSALLSTTSLHRDRERHQRRASDGKAEGQYLEARED
jgi:hypothetical protein